jgi:Caspase domain/TIR domain
MEAETGIQDKATEDFDVFLAYNSKDEAAVARVRAVDAILTSAGVRPWFAERDSIGGMSGPQAMADRINEARCSAMFLGESGLGRWQLGFELPAAIQTAVEEDDRRVFAVLLPGAVDVLPAGLRTPTVVNLRDEFDGEELTPKGIALIVSAVKGISPRQYEQEESAARAQAAAAAPLPGRRRALLVGVSEYDDDELSNLHGPKNDVAQLKDALANIRLPADDTWEITERVDPTYHSFDNALTEFFGADDADEDTVLFYFSGHGLVSGDSLLCAKDTQFRTPVFKSISSGRIADMIRSCKARWKVVILDCCYAAPIAEGHHYEELGDDVAVILASRGPADDATAKSDASPFTRELVGVFRDSSAYSSAGLTIRDLVLALDGKGQRPWTNAGGRAIPLARGVIEQIIEPVERPEPVTVEVPAEVMTSDRIPLVRQLSETLDALLAVASGERDIPPPVVHRTMEMIGEELRELVLEPEHLRAIEARRQENPESPPTIDLRFVTPEVRTKLADLPWEYLGVCPGAAAALPSGVDVMREPPVSVERLVPCTPKKLSGEPFVQHVAIFSSLRPGEHASTEHHVLSATTKARLEALGVSTEIVSAVTWQQFRGQRENADVVILHAPVHMANGRVEVGFESPPERELRLIAADSVRDTLKGRTALSWLFIEAVAEDPSKQPALAIRRFAETLAAYLERPIVAVCHARAYLGCLTRDESAATPFFAHLLRELGRLPLDQAAHAARRETVSSLAAEPSIVGIPIVIRPEPVVQADDAPRRVARIR